MLKKVSTSLALLIASLSSFTFAEVFGNGSEKTSGLQVPGAGAAQGEKLIDVIKNGINYFLLFLGLIVFIFLLYGGFLMISAAGDDGKYKKGFTILKHAGVGLVFIGLAWIVISFILNLIGVIAG